MYDLNRAIEHWKFSFAQSEACGREDAEELESHLREQIGILVESGLSQEEAFLVARSRLGDSERICGQFAEADPTRLWKRRLFWMAGGVFCWFAVILCQRVFLAMTDTAALFLGIRSGKELGITNVAASLIFLLLITLGYRMLYRRRTRHFRLAAFTATRARVVMCVVGTLLAGLCGKLFATAPMMYASRVLPSQEFGIYAMYRSFSGGIVIAVLAAAIIAFLALQFAGQHGQSVTATPGQ